VWESNNETLQHSAAHEHVLLHCRFVCLSYQSIHQVLRPSQHTATHCNTLQHAATKDRDTLQHMSACYYIVDLSVWCLSWSTNSISPQISMCVMCVIFYIIQLATRCNTLSMCDMPHSWHVAIMCVTFYIIQRVDPPTPPPLAHTAPCAGPLRFLHIRPFQSSQIVCTHA